MNPLPNLFTHSLPKTKPQTWAKLLGLGLLVLALPWMVGSMGDGWLRTLNLALLYVMLALGLNIVVGMAGLLDLGFIAFYAMGAYLYALLASPHLTDQFPTLAAFFPQGLHASVWLVLPLAALLAALCGLALGAPTLRLRGDYLAIVTLGFGEIIRLFLNNLNTPLNITNGPQGIYLIEPVRFGSLRFDRTVELWGTQVSSLLLYYYFRAVRAYRGAVLAFAA
jgi:branched-chain amino acid transport system permease protein